MKDVSMKDVCNTNPIKVARLQAIKRIQLRIDEEEKHKASRALRKKLYDMREQEILNEHSSC